jgi:predicted transposase YbfD/YdcC
MSNTGAPDSHSIDFLTHFSTLSDPRQQTKLLYPMAEVLLLTLCAVLSGANDWVAISAFGAKKLAFLRKFLPYSDGTPSHDQLGNIYAALDPTHFQACFMDWVASLNSTLSGVVAIDGKTSRRSLDKAGSKAAIHMISAWSSELNLTLAQRQVDGKSNEITAIPELLDLLTLKGAIVTIDAMGCQRDIAAKIIAKQADYVLALKGNQGALRKDTELFMKEQGAVGFADTTVTYHETVEKSHGRIETRKVTVCSDIEWLKARHNWPGLESIVVVQYCATLQDKTRSETRFYISSMTCDAETHAKAIRDHWGIENGLHWVMDMVFRDDECRIRKGNAPANFTTIKHAASNMLRSVKGNQSLRLKRHLAAWDEDFLFQIIHG